MNFSDLFEMINDYSDCNLQNQYPTINEPIWSNWSPINFTMEWNPLLSNFSLSFPLFKTTLLMGSLNVEAVMHLPSLHTMFESTSICWHLMDSNPSILSPLLLPFPVIHWISRGRDGLGRFHSRRTLKAISQAFRANVPALGGGWHNKVWSLMFNRPLITVLGLCFYFSLSQSHHRTVVLLCTTRGDLN